MLKIEQKTITKLPNLLFYEIKKGHFRLLNINKNICIGDMIVSPRKDELFINSLIINKNCRRKGFGTLFLKFAKSISNKTGFNGRMRGLVGLTTCDDNNPPHIFYRKFGFTTDDTKTLNLIDQAIKGKKQLDYKTAPLTYMYYHK